MNYIRLEMAAGICFRIDVRWFDFAFIYLVSLFGFLYVLYDTVLRSHVMSKKTTFFKLHLMSNFRPGIWKILIKYFLILPFW